MSLMNRRKPLSRIRIRHLLLAASGWLALAAFSYLPDGMPVRVLAVFAFVLFCPGLAISGLLTEDRLQRWVLTVALSISFGVLVTVAFNELHDDSTVQRLAVLASVTTVATIAAVWWSPGVRGDGGEQ
ncbi:hypothetical protein [Nocardia sp. NPDC020380]|uniref:hypothetical protein n=1 Tax=Nocardia sp. NPDC020380 TaxID=3364309 RepID=UPI0037903422